MKFDTLLIRLIADRNTLTAIEHTKGAPPGIGDLGGILRGHFSQFTIYNPLALVAGVVFFSTLLQPWWWATLYADQFWIQAFPYILKHNIAASLGAEYLIETPPVAVVFLKCLLVGYGIMLFWGSTMSGLKGALYVAFTGLCMLLYTAGFYGAIWYAAEQAGLPMTGPGWILYEVQIDIYMTLAKHYSIAIWSGAACMATALLHGFLPIRFYRKGKS